VKDNAQMMTWILLLAVVSMWLCWDTGKLPDEPPVEAVVYTASQKIALMAALADDNLLRAVEHVESHGNPNAVSPKGAKGRFQLMDGTAKKPGLGVKPIRNRSQKEQKRFARDYLDALLRHYHGNERLALAAYNAGPGRVDRVIAMLPKETREYVVRVQQFADNGE
jgi:membrane-bound lytic murein transglycosylase MltF